MIPKAPFAATRTVPPSIRIVLAKLLLTFCSHNVLDTRLLVL